MAAMHMTCLDDINKIATTSIPFPCICGLGSIERIDFFKTGETMLVHNMMIQRLGVTNGRPCGSGLLHLPEARGARIAFL
jgi:hypothetical protein